MDRATIHDVAAQARVSIKTVSRVLNHQRYVAEPTARRVRAAMAALDFRPSAAAQTLGGGRSTLVVLLCDNPNPHFLFQMQAGAQGVCRAAGRQLIVQPYDRAAGGLAGEVAASLDRLRPGGVILTPPASDDEGLLALLAERGVPVVRVSPAEPTDAWPTVRIDNEGAAHAAVAHLLDLGHRRVGLITGPADYAISRRRLDGARRALTGAGVAWDEGLVVAGRFDVESGRAVAARLLALADPPTAIFAANDEMAAGVLSHAHDRGLALPRQLSVVGFDHTNVAGVVWPPLTTIAQPFAELARVAADLLLHPTDPVAHRLLPTELVIGRSTGPPEA